MAGSTGEAAALYDAEYDPLLRSAVELVAGRIPVLAGTGLSNTAKTIEQTRRAAALGADAALVVTPPYVRPTQAGLVAHYRAVADDGALPVVLYNVPGRTGCDMLPETVAELAGHARIVGIKEARSDAERMDALLPLARRRLRRAQRRRPDRVPRDAGRRRRRDLGRVQRAAGCVPPPVRPGARRRARRRARRWTRACSAACDFLGVEPNPIPVKALLARMGIGHGLRLPLLPLSAAHADARRDDRRRHPRARTRPCRDALAA